MTAKVFIIIVNYNGKENTAECITSLKKINYKNYEIVIIDNASDDNSVEYLRKRFPDIKIIINDRNLGYAGGNNVGIRYGLEQGYDFTLLLNNDVVVNKDFLDGLVQTANSDIDAAVVGPLIYYYKTKIINFAGGFLDIKTYIPIIRGYKQNDCGEFNNVEEVDYVSGACFLVKRQIFEKIGLLNEDYFLLWEETDFCYRAKNTGYKILFQPHSVVWHKESASFRYINPVAYDYYQIRNKLLFLKNNVKNSIALRLNTTFQHIITIFRLFKRYKTPADYEKIKAIFWAIRDYYSGRYGKRY